MKKQRLDEKDERLMLIAVAQLSSEGRTQTEIARTLNISQPQVSRFLKAAVDRKILGVAPPPPLLEKNISLEEKEQAQAKYFASAELRNKLYPHIQNKNISFDVREFAGDEDQFARTAAARVLQLFRQSRRIGVMSGKNMHKLVEGIKFLTASSNAPFPYAAECIPLCGDPIHLMNLRQVDYSASHLAASINYCLTEKPATDLPCLTGVPAYVSRRLQVTKGFKEFLNSIPGYDLIFGSQKKGGARPRVDLIDTILTGIGIVSTKEDGENMTSAFIRERIEQEEASEENLNKIVLGDIGGLLIERNKSDRERVNRLNRGWIGMREEHFHQVAEGAHESGFPGVIVIAFGQEKKADLVFEIIKRGLVNHLLVHSALSKKLQALAAQSKS